MGYNVIDGGIVIIEGGRYFVYSNSKYKGLEEGGNVVYVKWYVYFSIFFA